MIKSARPTMRSTAKSASVTPPDLIEYSRAIGDPARDYVILGEGNTSLSVGDGTFWVKASGRKLATASADDFVRVRSDSLLAMLSSACVPSEADTLAALRAAKVGRQDGPLPSVEAVLHAVCLAAPAICCVAHSHPTAINAVTCSVTFAGALRGRLFPDQTVVCGTDSLLIKYVDPGLALAKVVAGKLGSFVRTHGRAPRTIYLQNHGFIALGESPQDVLNITAMADKAARILIGTYALGGPRLMPATEVRRIDQRLDEAYRRKEIKRQR